MVVVVVVEIQILSAMGLQEVQVPNCQGSKVSN
jgi:hypothetical protein